jgi:hypothetical protein
MESKIATRQPGMNQEITDELENISFCSSTFLCTYSNLKSRIERVGSGHKRCSGCMLVLNLTNNCSDCCLRPVLTTSVTSKVERTPIVTVRRLSLFYRIRRHTTRSWRRTITRRIDLNPQPCSVSSKQAFVDMVLSRQPPNMCKRLYHSP